MQHGFTRTRRVISDIPSVSSNPRFDPATMAWVTAVLANGGTVSLLRETVVDNLIVGLKAAGIWTKLDRLWLTAAENEPSALTDLVGLTLATKNGSPPFAVDDGYTGQDTSTPTNYIDSNFNPVTQGVNFANNNCHYSAWSTTNVVVTSGGCLVGNHFFTALFVTLFGGGNNVQGGIQDNTSPGVIGTTTDRTGLWLGNRDSSTTTQFYHNGSSFATPNVTSTGFVSQNFFLMAYNSSGLASNGSPQQHAMFSMGASLTAAQEASFYNLVRNYMTVI